MLKLIAYLLTAMMSWVAPEAQAPLETADAARARYESIARDIATVVLDGEVEPLFDGDDGRARTGLVLASIASLESNFNKRVDDGVVRGDHRAAWGISMTHKSGLRHCVFALDAPRIRGAGSCHDARRTARSRPGYA